MSMMNFFNDHFDEIPTKEDVPNYQRFRILEVYSCGDHIVAKIKYEDCLRYRGIKLLVYQDVNESQIRSASYIDPYFTHKYSELLTPIASFEPTELGLQLAIATAKTLSQ